MRRRIRLGAEKDLPVVVLTASLFIYVLSRPRATVVLYEDHDFEHDLHLPALGLHIGVLRYLERTILR